MSHIKNTIQTIYRQNSRGRKMIRGECVYCPNKLPEGHKTLHCDSCGNKYKVMNKRGRDNARRSN